MPNDIACDRKYPSNNVEMAQRFHFNVLDAIQNNIHIHDLPISITIVGCQKLAIKGGTFGSHYNIYNQDLTMNVAMILHYQTSINYFEQNCYRTFSFLIRVTV